MKRLENPNTRKKVKKIKNRDKEIVELLRRHFLI